MNKRNGIIDIWKFIAAMIIVSHHLPNIIGSWTPWRGGWIYCEFFYIITGFYTAGHFHKAKSNDRPREALFYIVRKFMSLFPYTTIAIFLIYFINLRLVADGGIKQIIYYFMDMPFEMLYIRVVRLTPLWFLSAMFLAFPIFTLILQIKNKYLICMLSIMYSIWYYYSIYDLHSETSWKRALAGLMLGAFVFYFDDLIKEERTLEDSFFENRVLMTFVELACLLLPMVYTFFTDPNYHIVLLLFIIGLWIVLTGRSNTSRICHGGGYPRLGRLSMLIYIFHAVVIGAINMVLPEASQSIRVIIYYMGTIAAAFLAQMISSRAKKAK